MTDSAETPSEVVRRAFPGLRDTEAVEIVSTGVVNQYPVNTILCHEDAVEYTFYIILDGEVEVTKVINAAQTRELKHLRAGEFFGEMALIHNAPRAATVMTVKPTTVLEINKEAFNVLLQKNSSVSLAMVREVSRRLRENDAMAIDDLRLKADELAKAYQQLAELEYARHDFLTTIAHELRTPLTAANGFIQMIRKGALQGEALNSALDTVAKNMENITTLVNDILFLQEMDFIMPDFHPLDLGAVVALAFEKQRARAERSGVGLSLSIAPSLPRVQGDPKSMERALTAILDNAIKFSPEGGNVQIQVWSPPVIPGEVHHSEVCISVTDQGVGIPPEALPRVFDRFYRLEEVQGHLFGGVGLGLSIAKQVVENHNGQITAQSTLGEGSTFTIRLKLAM